MNSIVISINHTWAELIYKGHKTIELRKTKPSKPGPYTALIYDTELKRITGTMDIEKVLKVPNGPILETLCKKACVTPDFAEGYRAHGRGELYAWIIGCTLFMDNSWHTLEELGIKRAPQSWQYYNQKKLIIQGETL